MSKERPILLYMPMVRALLDGSNVTTVGSASKMRIVLTGDEIAAEQIQQKIDAHSVRSSKLNKMFLDSDEVRELTNRIQHASQAKVLRAMGIEHKPRPDGTLAVLRAHVEHCLGGAQAARRTPSAMEPNWGALHAARA